MEYQEYHTGIPGGSGLAVVASQTLVFHVPGPIPGLSDASASLSQHVTSGSGVSSASGQAGADRMAVERGRLPDLGLPEDVVNTLLATAASNTASF